MAPSSGEVAHLFRRPGSQLTETVALTQRDIREKGLGVPTFRLQKLLLADMLCYMHRIPVGQQVWPGRVRARSSTMYSCRSIPTTIAIDQSAVGVSNRSISATYTGIMDDVRKTFATANLVNPGLFSFNSKGACEHCQGLSVVYTDLAYLDEVKLPCDVCGGRRFKEEVLRYKLNGRSVADVLSMTVSELSIS